MQRSVVKYGDRAEVVFLIRIGESDVVGVHRGVADLLIWLDKPFPGALSLALLYVEVLDDDLERVEVELWLFSSIIITHRNIALLFYLQAFG